MITLGMVVAAWIIMEVLMGTGHVSSLLKDSSFLSVST